MNRTHTHIIKKKHTQNSEVGYNLTFPLTFVFLCISIELPCSQDKVAVVRLVLGFHPATLPGICTNKCRFSCTELTHNLLIHHWWYINAGALGMMHAQCACLHYLRACWKAGDERKRQIKEKKGNSEWQGERCAAGVGGGGGGDGKTERVWW